MQYMGTYPGVGTYPGHYGTVLQNLGENTTSLYYNDVVPPTINL